MKTKWESIKKFGKRCLYVTLALGLLGGGAYGGYKGGCYKTRKEVTSEFHTLLLTKKLAEYNSGNGEWQLKDISEMLPNIEDSHISLMQECELPMKAPTAQKKIAKR
jgi:hypothetical protein